MKTILIILLVIILLPIFIFVIFPFIFSVIHLFIVSGFKSAAKIEKKASKISEEKEEAEEHETPKDKFIYYVGLVFLFLLINLVIDFFIKGK